MNVPSYEFFAFSALVALAINASNRHWWRSLVLLLANVAFVSSFAHDPRSLGPFAVFLAFGFVNVKLLERFKQRAAAIVLVAATVAAFCVLRQYAFLPSLLLLPFAYATIGISYVFFRVVHVMVDAYQDALPERMEPIAYLNYTLNFTALVAGPIQLYRDYRRTASESPAALGWADIRSALARIVTGFFKVSVVSPLLLFAHAQSVAALPVAGPLLARAAYATLVLAIYPAYLYFNFSGYTDVVVGTARFLRIELPENFNKPFAARGFIDFWTRWHMSLANWMKTYVYFPLVMMLMRRRPSRKLEPAYGVAGYFITFFVVGLWHGTTTMFVFLGVLLGLGVSANKIYSLVVMQRLGRKRYAALCDEPVYAAVSRGATYAYWSFSSLWFWSSWSQLREFAVALGPAGIAVVAVLLVVVASVVLALPALVRARVSFDRSRYRVPARYAAIAWYTTLVVITVSVTVVLDAPAPHIVYRAF